MVLLEHVNCVGAKELLVAVGVMVVRPFDLPATFFALNTFVVSPIISALYLNLLLKWKRHVMMPTMTHKPSSTFLYKLEGYYLIPHELLHVLAYRLIGKPCDYRWGDHQVHGTAAKSRGERIFVLLLPFVTCWAFALFFHWLWVVLALSAQMPPEQYFSQEGPYWHFIFPAIATLFILYSGTAYRDIRSVLQILA
jgi:hypothetical protein